MRYGFIGDILQITPVVRIVQEKYPDAIIDFWVSRKASVALDNNPRIHAIVDADKYGPLSINKIWSIIKCGWSLRAGNYDAAICLNAEPVSGMLAWLGKIPFRIGLINAGQKAAFLHKYIVVPPDDTASRQFHYVSLIKLLGGTGIISEFPPIELYWVKNDEKVVDDLLKNEKRELVAFFPGGGENIQYRPWANRKWPVEKWTSLGKSILEKYPEITLLLFGSASDEDSIKKITKYLPAKRFLNVCGKTTLCQLGPLLKKCRVLVTNDSAPVFVAAAVGCPTVVLYGPEWPERAKPLGFEHWYPVWSETVCRANCAAFPVKGVKCENECENGLEVEKVLKTICKVLKLFPLE
jgi:lipopolysaccharide heptosyltransferase II